MAFSLGGSWDGSWSGASDAGLGNWGTMGGGSKSSGGSSLDPVTMGLAVGGQLLGNWMQGNTAKGLAKRQSEDAANQALWSTYGIQQSANDAFAGRAQALAFNAGTRAQNTLNFFGNSLFNADIDKGRQAAATQEDLWRFAPQRLAMQRKENELATAFDQSFAARTGREMEAKENRLAGAYMAALPGMIQYGKINLPTA